jgi:hypothetical protein
METNLRDMSTKEFAWFGIFDRAYLKPLTVKGTTIYAICAADGTVLLHVEDLGTARLVARQDYALEPLSIH